MRDVATEKQDAELSAEISESYLVHRFRKGLQRYKLLPRSGDRETFQALIESKFDKVDKSRNIYSAYSYFHKLIRNHCQAPQNDLKSLFALIVSRLYLVVISLEEEDPYEIFESLNSTGLPLEESDLIRNFLFMQVPIENQGEFQDELWQPFESRFTIDDAGVAIRPTHFYRDFLRREGKYVSAKNTFSEFKAHYQENGFTPAKAVAVLSDFLEYARQVATAKFPDAAVTCQLQHFAQLDTSVATPLILNLFQRHSVGALSTSALANCIRNVNSFILRRSICGESTRGYGNWFCECIQQLGTQPEVQLEAYLLHRGWPDDQTFERNLIEFPIYARENQKCRLLLQELEKAFGHKEKVDLAPLQIEHIMPQTLTKSDGENCWFKMLGSDAKSVHKRYLHTLGNLTLTGYNPKLSNKPFKDKVEEFKSSNLSINKEILKVKKWDEAQITTRAQDLSTRITTIWPRPKSDIAFVPLKVARDEVFKAGRERRAEYWKRLTQMLRDSHSPVMPRRPSDGTIIEMFLPVSDVQLYVQYLRPKSQLAVQLRFFRERGKQIYRSLVQEKQILERELRIPITWSDGTQPEIVAVKGDVSIKDPLDWLEQHEWITATLARFAETLHNRIVTTHVAIKEKSEAKQLLLDFWLGFHSYLYQHGNTLPHTAAQSSNNNDFPTGRSAFWYSTIVAPTLERLTVALMVGSDVSRRAWPGLVAESQAIESAVGAELEWNSQQIRKFGPLKLTEMIPH